MGISVRKVNSHCAAVTTPKWFQLMDAGKEIRVVLLDPRKVFDSIRHQALLYTELNEVVLKWICDYLTQRNVVIARHPKLFLFSLVYIKAVIEPLLFLIYIGGVMNVAN